MPHMKSVIAVAVVAFLTSPLASLAQSETRNLATEEANRQIVVDFYNKVFNDHEVDKGARNVADEYKQHNPLFPNGKVPFTNAIKERFAKNPEARSRIVRSAAQNDLVWIHVHRTMNPNDRGSAIVDIFRVTDGKIVEHWDVIQPVPEEAANANTMF